LVKLIIQIPCLNEAASLPTTIANLPKRVEGFDVVESLVIDDGSSDETVAVARSLGVDHIVRMTCHQGLARAFLRGLDAAVERGADVIVNNDADNQYDAAGINALVKPILEGHADIVIGARPMGAACHFSLWKRFLQILGSRVVSWLAGVVVRDATSGFRAISRKAALRLNVFGNFTYTIETIVQAGLSNMRIVNVPIAFKSVGRPSRLFRSNCYYVCQSVLTMASTYMIYRPARICGAVGVVLLLPGVVLGLRYLLLIAAGEGRGQVQSGIAAAVLVVAAIFVGLIGVVAHLQRISQQMLEDVRFLLRSERLDRRDRFGYEGHDGWAHTMDMLRNFEKSHAP
jgi:glycosyltransferase involved in cell wall biosynthesis